MTFARSDIQVARLTDEIDAAREIGSVPTTCDGLTRQISKRTWTRSRCDVLTALCAHRPGATGARLSDVVATLGPRSSRTPRSHASSRGAAVDRRRWSPSGPTCTPTSSCERPKDSHQLAARTANRRAALLADDRDRTLPRAFWTSRIREVRDVRRRPAHIIYGQRTMTIASPSVVARAVSLRLFGRGAIRHESQGLPKTRDDLRELFPTLPGSITHAWADRSRCPRPFAFVRVDAPPACVGRRLHR